MEEIIGTTIINGNIRLGHTLFEVGVIKDCITIHKPDNFVEIGIHEGGLSYLLIPELNYSTNYFGIELNCQIIKPEVRVFYDDPLYRASLLCGDCFSEEILSRIRNLEGRKIIYCDGGHKATELVHYSKLLKSSDIILSHDYSDGTRSGKGLPETINAEVLPTDIEFLVNDPSFHRMNEKLFEHTRIIGFIKK